MRYVRAFLDNSLEVAIALARALALLGALALGPISLGLIWDESGHLEEWTLTLLVVGTLATLAGFLGFYVLGNPEWRRGAANDRAA